eukprot:TRINITY_DN15794_c0_g1_i1.p1 TRINITY_DN15794_c0_g1~~TRINITY_DN15794_c0_g1_i1.p1  ORF type:complete len:109 (+),score=19.44 TRINITY_DN15794_c0_g1_i1:526-852(+)
MSRIQSAQVTLAKRIPEIKARVESGADASLKSAAEAETRSLLSVAVRSEDSAEQVVSKEREDIWQQVCYEIRNGNACASPFGVDIDEELQKSCWKLLPHRFQDLPLCS